MPIRGIGEGLGDHRWIFSFRTIEGIDADRARFRVTLNYRLTDWLQAGVEWNPKGDQQATPLANVRVLKETRWRPALIVGTSSDRIGTEKGQAYFATLSKNLKPWLGLPVSPYVGVSYNDRDYEFLEIAGLNYRLSSRFSVTHLYDGENLHHTLDAQFGRHTVGLIVAEQDGEYFLGLTYGGRY